MQVARVAPLQGPRLLRSERLARSRRVTWLPHVCWSPSDHSLCACLTLQGRTKWVLEPESSAVEVDVSAFSCRLVKSEAVLNTADADDEVPYLL